MDKRRVIKNITILFAIMTAAVGITLMFHTTAPAKNYEQVICDDEPNPDLCKEIGKWYQDVKMPTSSTPSGSIPTSCCGVGDAYWFEPGKVVDEGMFATIRDDRVIQYRKPRDGQEIFIPWDKLDDRHQGNPTAHSVVFLGAGFIYPFGPSKTYPAVYCAFPDLAG